MNRVTVVVPSWNGGAWIDACLRGVRSQTFKDFSVILVDNGSTDGSIHLVEHRYPEVRIRSLNRNRGFSRACNEGIRLSAGEYVAFLNNDAVPDPEWLHVLVEALDREGKAGAACPKILLEGAEGLIDRAGDGYSRAGVGMLRGRCEPARRYGKREWVFGAGAAAALYRREMLEAVGGFDEDLFLLYEDVDLCFRGQLMGYRCLYVPEATVYHRASGSLLRDSELSVYYGHRNLEWVYVKNMPASLMAKTLLPHLAYDLGAFFYFLGRGRGKTFLRAKRDALRGMRRMLKKRREIQKKRTVSDAYIWSMMSREGFFDRLKSRRPRGLPATNRKLRPVPKGY